MGALSLFQHDKMRDESEIKTLRGESEIVVSAMEYRSR